MPEIDPRQVAYYRNVLRCLPTSDPSIVRERISELRDLAKSVDHQFEEFKRLVAELDEVEFIAGLPKIVELAFFQTIDPPEPWRVARPQVPYKASQECWTHRPASTAALRVWVLFEQTLGTEPARIYRTSLKTADEWAAEFRRLDGSLMYVGLQDLEKRPEAEIHGWYPAKSLCEIVERMIERRVDNTASKE